jgi:hypothetical protein
VETMRFKCEGAWGWKGTLRVPRGPLLVSELASIFRVGGSGEEVFVVQAASAGGEQLSSRTRCVAFQEGGSINEL